MNCKPVSSGLVRLSAILASALVVFPALAQQEATTPDADPSGRLMIEIGTWIAKPSGLEDSPATRLDPPGPFSSLLQFDHGTSLEGLYRVGFRMPGNWGRIVATYYTHNDSQQLNESTPGRYVFGESWAHSLYAGYKNDGLADGFEAQTETQLRDTQLDWRRRAFKTTRFTGEWKIGWRRVSLRSSRSAEYLGILDDIPPLIPPVVDCTPDNCPDLNPDSDTVSFSSNFDGRGFTGGMDFEYSVWKNKIVIETGASLSILRGKTATSYLASNAAYVCQTGIAGLCDPGDILNPALIGGQLDYDYFADPSDPNDSNSAPIGSSVGQSDTVVGLQAQSRETSANVLDAYLGFRWRALNWFDIIGGFRMSRYDGVGVELRPKVSSLSLGAVGSPVYNVSDVTETDRSVNYEGFYVGLAFNVF